MAVMPSYTVRVDWNNDGDFSDANEDITAYVRSITISLGRSVDFQQFVVGTCEVVLDNEDKRFSPENDSSPLYDNVKLYRPLQVYATWSGSSFHLFYGFISRYSLRPYLEAKLSGGECYVYAQDPFAWLKSDQVTTTLYKDKAIHEIVDLVLDEINLPSNNRAIDQVGDTVRYAGWRDVTLLRALEDLTGACGGHHFIEPDTIDSAPYYKYRFESRYHWYMGTDHTESKETWTDEFSSFDYDLNDSEVRNFISVRARTRSKGERQTLWNLESVPIYMGAGETLGFWANFSEFVDDLVTPVAGTDYTANVESDGSGTDKTDEISISFSGYALTADFEVTNNDSSAVWLTKLKLRGKRVQENPAEASVAEDSTSQALYKRRPLVVDNKLIDDVATARGVASYYLHWYKNPRPQIGQLVRLNQFPSQLQRKIGDKITLQQTALSVDRDYHIHSVQHKINLAGLQHETTYRVQDSSVGELEAEWFQLDVSQLDVGQLIW